MRMVPGNWQKMHQTSMAQQQRDNQDRGKAQHLKTETEMLMSVIKCEKCPSPEEEEGQRAIAEVKMLGIIKFIGEQV